MLAIVTLGLFVGVWQFERVQQILSRAEDYKTFAFSSSGFIANEKLSTWVVFENGQALALPQQKADANGNVAFVALADEAKWFPGMVQIVAHGMQSKKEVLVSAQYRPPPKPVSTAVNKDLDAKACAAAGGEPGPVVVDKFRAGSNKCEKVQCNSACCYTSCQCSGTCGADQPVYIPPPSDETGEPKLEGSADCQTTAPNSAACAGDKGWGDCCKRYQNEGQDCNTVQCGFEANNSYLTQLEILQGKARKSENPALALSQLAQQNDYDNIETYLRRAAACKDQFGKPLDNSQCLSATELPSSPADLKKIVDAVYKSGCSLEQKNYAECVASEGNKVLALLKGAQINISNTENSQITTNEIAVQCGERSGYVKFPNNTCAHCLGKTSKEFDCGELMRLEIRNKCGNYGFESLAAFSEEKKCYDCTSGKEKPASCEPLAQKACQQEGVDQKFIAGCVSNKLKEFENGVGPLEAITVVTQNFSCASPTTIKSLTIFSDNSKQEGEIRCSTGAECSNGSCALIKTISSVPTAVPTSASIPVSDAKILAYCGRYRLDEEIDNCKRAYESILYWGGSFDVNSGIATLKSGFTVDTVVLNKETSKIFFESLINAQTFCEKHAEIELSDCLGSARSVLDDGGSIDKNGNASAKGIKFLFGSYGWEKSDEEVDDFRNGKTLTFSQKNVIEHCKKQQSPAFCVSAYRDPLNKALAIFEDGTFIENGRNYILTRSNNSWVKKEVIGGNIVSGPDVASINEENFQSLVEKNASSRCVENDFRTKKGVVVFCKPSEGRFVGRCLPGMVNFDARTGARITCGEEFEWSFDTTSVGADLEDELVSAFKEAEDRRAQIENRFSKENVKIINAQQYWSVEKLDELEKVLSRLPSDFVKDITIINFGDFNTPQSSFTDVDGYWPYSNPGDPNEAVLVFAFEFPSNEEDKKRLQSVFVHELAHRWESFQKKKTPNGESLSHSKEFRDIALQYNITFDQSGNYSGDTQKNLVDLANGFSQRSSYECSKDNSNELFACLTQLYYDQPEKLKERTPLFYDYVKVKVFEGKEFLPESKKPQSLDNAQEELDQSQTGFFEGLIVAAGSVVAGIFGGLTGEKL